MRNLVAATDRPEALALANDMFHLAAGTLSILRLCEPRIGALAVGGQRFGGHRDKQVVPGPDRVAAEVVGFANLGHRRVVLTGDLGNRLAALYLVALPAYAVVCGNVLQCRRKRIGCRNGHYQPVGACRVGGPAVVAGVVGVHGIHIDARQFGGECEIELRADIGHDELHFVRHGGQRQVVGIGVFDDVDEGEELRHVHARLARQLEVPEIDRLARLAISLD